MFAMHATVLCGAYILGLLLTAIAWQVRGFPAGAIACLLLGVGFAFFMPRLWRTGPKFKIWIAAGLIGCLAVFYLQVRVPAPGPNDISQLITESSTTSEVFQVRGLIKTVPRLTRSQKLQFWLQVTEVSALHQSGIHQDEATPTMDGKVYTTVPLLQGTGLRPGQLVTVTGSLYLPKPASNPGGFDFKAYLAQQGGFAGLSGTRVAVPEGAPSPPWGWWRVRQRIVRAQVRSLGVPEGPLVSAIVLGRNGVDLTYALQDQFSQVGLAHALAASGFQVSLLVGFMMTLTRRLPVKARLVFGTAVLISYIGLTGIQPSVLRAGFMGFAALIAMTANRKVKPLGSVLLAAMILLLFNPLWIWDLGFQLSFLATLGLLITVPPLTKRLDWLPPAIAAIVAVPMAAYLWTLPLQLQVFGVVSPYTILINVLATPLLTGISMGGMVSAVGAVIWPEAGSAIAAPLYYPAHALIQLAEFCNQLPGNSVAVGQISALQVVGLYGLFGWIWWQSRRRKPWGLPLAISLGLVILPVAYSHTQLLQVTVLATSREPVIVLQDRGKVGLINSGSETDVHFVVLPFLRQQGINRIDWAIAPSNSIMTLEGWQRLSAALPIRTLYSSLWTAPNTGQFVATDLAPSPVSEVQQIMLSAISHSIGSQGGSFLPLPVEQPILRGAATLQVLSEQAGISQLQVQEQRWLLLQGQAPIAATALMPPLPTADVLCWSGASLLPEALSQIVPKVAIAASSVDLNTADWLDQHQVDLYSVARDGAVQWRAQQGFSTTMALSDSVALRQ